MMIDTTFRIPKANFPWLNAQVEKLNTRAKKLNLPSLAVFEGFAAEPYVMKAADHGLAFDYEIPAINVRLVGKFPVLAGWHLVGRLNKTENGKNIVSLVPGEGEPPDWIRDFYGCQHCGHNRYRKDVFALAHEDGTYKVVGRTCLQDFLGGMSPDTLINWATMIDRLIDTIGKGRDGWVGGGVPRAVQTFPLEPVLMLTSAEIAVYGWVSAAKAYNEGKDFATKHAVMAHLEGNEAAYRRTKRLHSDAAKKGVTIFSDADLDEVRKAIEWAKNLTDTSNTYLHNIKTLAENGHATWRDIGMACSILPTYRREAARAAEQAARKAATAPSVHLGSVGAKIEFEATVLYLNTFDNGYGGVTLVKMKTDNGNIINWWASVAVRDYEAHQAIHVKDRVKVKATVKKHETYKDEPQTTVTRAKMWKV
jgi:hypothetical protein